MSELLLAVNPDPESRLKYLMRVPLGGGLVFRTSGTWPREKALFCYQLETTGWPDDPEAGNVARLYARMASDLRDGGHTAPRFDDAVRIHRIIAAIEEAAETGRRTRPK